MKYASKNRTSKTAFSGFTLIEVLVVIAIMAILVALTIPQIRMISRDRGVRESARIVASAVSSASHRATVDGIAGIHITRDKNLIDPNPGANAANEDGIVHNFATVLYEMHAVPDYTGNSVGDVATSGGPGLITVPAPLSDSIQIQRGDTIFVGDRGIGYRISDIIAGALVVEVNETTPRSSVAMPVIPPEGLPFRIKLRPRVMESSRIDLPAGYLVDLRYSGILTDVTGSTNPRRGSCF